MKKEPVHKIIEEYSRKPYVDNLLLVSSVYGSISPKKNVQAISRSVASLLSVTYEGTKELVNNVGLKLTEVNVKTNTGHSIIIRPLDETHFLAVQVRSYNEKVMEDIDNLISTLGPSIEDLDL
ncbi:MAG: hypothetical protein QXN66_03625 [Thermoplasmatales archaeon]